MNGFLGGLLGDTPEEEQAAKSALLMAGLTGLMASGPSLQPTSFGQILGQAGMTGVSAYEGALKKAQEQSAAKELQQAFAGQGQGVDRASMANKYRQAAAQFSATDPQKANLYLQMADKIEGDAQRFTGNAANVAYSMFGTADVTQLTPEQRQSVVDAVQQQSTAAARAGAPVVNVKYGESFGSKLGGMQAQMISDSQQQAQSAVGTIGTVAQMKPLVDQAYTGPGSTTQVALARIGEKLGVGGANRQELLQNTANLIKGAAQLELDAAKEMRGQGQITENEREILRRAQSADPTTLTQAEINAVLNTLETRAAKRIQYHNDLLNRFIQTQDPSVARQLELYRVAPPVPVRRK